MTDSDLSLLDLVIQFLNERDENSCPECGEEPDQWDRCECDGYYQ